MKELKTEWEHAAGQYFSPSHLFCKVSTSMKNERGAGGLLKMGCRFPTKANRDGLSITGLSIIATEASKHTFQPSHVRWGQPLSLSSSHGDFSVIIICICNSIRLLSWARVLKSLLFCCLTCRFATSCTAIHCNTATICIWALNILPLWLCMNSNSVCLHMHTDRVDE